MKKTILLLTISLFSVLSVFGQKSALHYEILQAKDNNRHFDNIVLTKSLQPCLFVRIMRGRICTVCDARAFLTVTISHTTNSRLLHTAGF